MPNIKVPLPKVKLKFDDDRRVAILEEEYTLQGITIPKGFKTDGMSIPKSLHWWMPQWSDGGDAAALLHDYLKTCISNGQPHPKALTWKQADRIFYKALVEDLGLSKFKAGMLWTGVELYTFSMTHTGKDKFTPSNTDKDKFKPDPKPSINREKND